MCLHWFVGDVTDFPGLPAKSSVYLQEFKEIGVSDGIRTRDVQIHSLALYQAELRSPFGSLGRMKASISL